MNSKISKLVLAIGALMMVGGAWAAQDASATETMSATISPDCSVGNNVPLSYPSLKTIGNNGEAFSEDQIAFSMHAFKAICVNGTANPQFKFVSKNATTASMGYMDTSGVMHPATSGSGFQLAGADGKSFIAYSLYGDSVPTATTAIAYNTAAPHRNFSANGISQDLPLSTKILSTDVAGKPAQAYTDTVTVYVEFSTT